MDAGEIVAIGAHDELLNTQPLYRALVESMQEHQRRQPVALRRALTPA
jgi:ABC-type transport system involved in cytochrome bd biosynthesis fused ATPase/permease subunit